MLTVLVNLYEEPEKPANALEYPFAVVQYFEARLSIKLKQVKFSQI